MKRIGIVTLCLMTTLVAVTPSLAQNGRSVRAQVARESAQERVEAIKEKIAERRATVKAGICERREARLNTIVARLHTQAGKLKTVIDTMYIRVQGFYESGQLTVANYDELKLAIDTDSADADAAVSTLESFVITVDCENPGLGGQLDGFRTAVKETRDALKDYRKALVDLISALKSASADKTTENTNDDNGGDQ